MKLTHEEVNELIGKYKSELRKLAYQQQNLSGIIKTLEGQSKSAPKRRGRPAKAKAAAPKAAPKRRGRPAKAKAAAPAAPKKRGRPAKAKAAAPKAAPKKRGRPAKAKVAAPKAAPKKRGRPAKAKVAAPKAAPKRRGRPAKAKAAAPKAAAKKPAAKKPAAKKPAAAKKGYRLSDWDNLVMKTLNDRKKVSVFSDFMATAKAGGSKLSDQDIYRRINQSLHKLANKRKDLVKVPQKGRGFGYALPGWKS